MSFMNLKKSLREAIEKADNFSEFKKVMPDMNITEKAFNDYKKQQQGKNKDLNNKSKKPRRRGLETDPKGLQGGNIPPSTGRQESIDAAQGKPVFLKSGGLPKKPKMTGTGSYKGKKHMYAAGGLVKELKM